MIKALVAKLLLLPPMWFAPGTPPRETPEQYEQRMETLARAADAAAKRVRWQWGESAMRRAVLGQWYGETRFDLDVHRGLPGRYGSDDGQSKCLGQIHRSAVKPTVWRSLGGTDLPATTRCAIETARVLARLQRRCASRVRLTDWSLGVVFAGMGTGKCTKPRRAAMVKVRAWRRLH